MDAIEEWTNAQRRVTALVADLTGERADAIVPACPDWTVRNLLSHMIGLDADVLAGDEPDDHNSAWTQRQVDARRDHDVATLLDEWRTLTEPLQAWMRENGSRPMGDVVIHEQDLRDALDAPGAQRTPGLYALRERMVGGFAEQVDDLPPIALVGDDWEWTSAGDAAEAAVLVRASDFDLIRSLMSRRSEAQLRSWTERGDIGAYLAAFGALGPLPASDLAN